MENRWYFSQEGLNTIPSRRCGMSKARELRCRQKSASFIQEMGRRLYLEQTTIDTAVVFMHRFYMLHSFTDIPSMALPSAAVFLAAKSESQHTKLEHVIKLSHHLVNGCKEILDVRSETYKIKESELLAYEEALLMTLGFNVHVGLPHSQVEYIWKIINAGEDLTKVAYFMASNNLHLTTMCLMYKPKVVASFCVHLACKWLQWEIKPSNEGKHWFKYIDPSLTYERLEGLIKEFLDTIETTPLRLKRNYFVQKVATNNNFMDAIKNEAAAIKKRQISLENYREKRRKQ